MDKSISLICYLGTRGQILSLRIPYDTESATTIASLYAC